MKRHGHPTHNYPALFRAQIMTTYKHLGVALGYGRKPLQGENSAITTKGIGIMGFKKNNWGTTGECMIQFMCSPV